MMAPNMEKPMMNPTAEVAVKVRFLNSQSGMMGSATLVSIQQKMPSVTRATSPRPMISGGAPGVLGTGPGGEQDDAGDADREEGRPGPVDLVGYPLDRDVQHGGHNEQGHDTERHVDVEDPAPGQVLGEQSAEQGAGNVGDAEDDTEVAHVPPPLPGRDDIAHDGLGPDHQPAGPDALDGPEGDELDHGLGQARTAWSRPGRSRWPAGRGSCARRGRPSFPHSGVEMQVASR